MTPPPPRRAGGRRPTGRAPSPPRPAPGRRLGPVRPPRRSGRRRSPSARAEGHAAGADGPQGAARRHRRGGAARRGLHDRDPGAHLQRERQLRQGVRRRLRVDRRGGAFQHQGRHPLRLGAHPHRRPPRAHGRGVAGVAAAEGQVVAQIRVLDQRRRAPRLLPGPAQLRPQLADVARAQRLEPSTREHAADRTRRDRARRQVGRRRRASPWATPCDVAGHRRGAGLHACRASAASGSSTPGEVPRPPCSTPRPPRPSWASRGTFDWISVAGGDGVSQDELAERGRRRAAARHRGHHRRRVHRREPGRLPEAHRHLQHVPAGLRPDRALRRLVHHLQHVLGHRRPAHPGAGPAPGDRRPPAPGAGLGAARGARRRASWPRPSGWCAGIGLAMGLNALLRNIGFAGPETPLVVPASAVVVVAGGGHPHHPGCGRLPRPEGRRPSPPVAAMRDVAWRATGTSTAAGSRGAVLVARRRPHLQRSVRQRRRQPPARRARGARVAVPRHDGAGSGHRPGARRRPRRAAPQSRRQRPDGPGERHAQPRADGLTASA